MKVSDIYGSKYLKAEEVGKKTIDAVIEDVESEDVKGQDGEKRPRLVIQLEGVPKPLILNATNANACKEAFGDDTDEWIGNAVKVRVEKVEYQGKKVPGIRLTPIPPALPA